jgi:hypothetical protein
MSTIVKFDSNNPTVFNANWSPKWNATIEIIKNGAVRKNYSINSPISYISFSYNDSITGATYENYYTDSEGRLILMIRVQILSIQQQ